MSRIHFLAHHGSSFVSRAIRWQTRSEWNHISVCIDDLVYEAMEGVGVRVRSIQSIAEDVLARRERVISLRLLQDVSDESVSEMRAFLHSQIEKPYDYTMVLRFISRVNRESDESSAKWFCSELAFAAARLIDVHLFRNTSAWEVTPGLFVRSPLLAEEPSSWFEEMLKWQPRQ